MKKKIDSILPNHTLSTHDSENLYVVDYKDLNRGDVVLLEAKPDDIKYVYLSNERKVEVYFDGFKDNALEISTGLYSSQCECVTFPTNCGETDWILFVETKYANNRANAFSEVNGYPHKMVDQIIETVKYFRDKKIIPENKKVSAIVSFPNLVEEFNSTLFTGDLSIDDILTEHKIIIRGTNTARIISEKRIKLIDL